MESPGAARLGRIERTRQRRLRAEKIETVLIVTLAGLVVVNGAAAVSMIALGVAKVMLALMRL